MDRRQAIKSMSMSTGAIALLKGNINHAVCRWCYGDIPLEIFAESIAEMGLKGIDLLKPSEWSVANTYGLKCSMATDNIASIEHGFNDINIHKKLQKGYKVLIDQAADAGVEQVIVFSGNTRKLTNEIGLENCAQGLDVLVKQAEKRGVTLVMELLNSKVDHVDYQCDNSSWGVALTKKIGSKNFKLLYDVFHMQIMEGDVIATIRKYHQYYSHYHTGGVPGRYEINDSQELNYPAIMKAIVETGYKGFVAQEFIPTYDDKLAALQEGITICDV